jgi:phosphatidylethanolamine-binding protein (PEBP) family uncharacterized protein
VSDSPATHCPADLTQTRATNGGVQIPNSSDEGSYARPCAPSVEHDDRFTVYAVHSATGLTERASLAEAVETIGGHAPLTGR